MCNNNKDSEIIDESNTQHAIKLPYKYHCTNGAPSQREILRGREKKIRVVLNFQPRVGDENMRDKLEAGRSLVWFPFQEKCSGQLRMIEYAEKYDTRKRMTSVNTTAIAYYLPEPHDFGSMQ